MISVDSIIHAKWLITCEEKNQILLKHALIINKGKIEDILSSEQTKERYESANTEYYPQHAIIPGFINGHTHVPMSYFRGLADDLKLMDWLTNHIWPAEKKWLSSEFVYDASLFAMAEMIRGGTTCFNDMFFFMPDIANAIKISGMRGHVGAHFISFPNNWACDFEEELTKAIEFLEQYKNDPFVTPTIAAHSMYTLTEDSYLLRIKELAEKYNVKINMHVQEPRDEIGIVLQKSNLRPFQRLEALGLCSPRLIAIHALHLNDQDLDIIEKCKPNIVHCPQSNMKLASGSCRVTALQTRGINVALGTDSVASNNDLNMLGEMRTAAFLAKHDTQDSVSLSAEHVLKMATLYGAKALGIDHLTGSLTQGKFADFSAIDLNMIETLPTYHPISQIVYSASRHQITDVWVAGKQLLKNRTLLTLNEAELKSKANHWSQLINNTGI
jgi:5-methylthioadenosine/S-adenosylhomocysteine deaminase